MLAQAIFGGRRLFIPRAKQVETSCRTHFLPSAFEIGVGLCYAAHSI